MIVRVPWDERSNGMNDVVSYETAHEFVVEAIAYMEEDGYPQSEAIVLAAETFEIHPVVAAQIWERLS